MPKITHKNNIKIKYRYRYRYINRYKAIDSMSIAHNK
jgi:hypothetical protein